MTGLVDSQKLDRWAADHEAQHAPQEMVDALAGVLTAHGLQRTPTEIIVALVKGANAMQRRRRSRNTSWPDEERRAAIAHAKALVSYKDAPPRNAATPASRRSRLVASLDKLVIVVRLTASPTCLDLVVIVNRLRRQSETSDDLRALIDAIEAQDPPKRTGRPAASYVLLIRGTAFAWIASDEGRQLDSNLTVRKDGKSVMTGPFPNLLRDVFKCLHVRWPGDEAVRQHVMELEGQRMDGDLQKLGDIPTRV